VVDPPGCGVTSRSRKRGSLAGASESRSGGERHGAPRATPRPLVGEPHPEETLEAPELRSLPSAAKHDELLPQRQIFEREVGAGSERRTQRAQQRVRGTLPPWLARRWVIVQSLRRDFGKRQARMFPPLFAISVAILTDLLKSSRQKPPPSKSMPPPPPPPRMPLRLVWSRTGHEAPRGRPAAILDAPFQSRANAGMSFLPASR